MKIIVTTSDKYLHLVPVFEYLYLKYWGDRNIEYVGYDKPQTELPFHSMGKQGPVNEWSTDLRKYFETQDESFIWIMEDTLIKRVFPKRIPDEVPAGVGKICLTNDVSKRDHVKMLSSDFYLRASQTSKYRLSTQPSIWNKQYLLQYLKPGLTPWEFETQDPMNDGWHVYGVAEPIVIHNEGVRKHDPFKVDLTGFPPEDITYLKNMNSWLK